MDRILNVQQADGLWRSSLLDPESYPGGEASGSGFYLYSMAWGVNNKLLDKKKFLPAVRKGWTDLNALVHENGKVGWTQPIGAATLTPIPGKFTARARIFSPVRKSSN